MDRSGHEPFALTDQADASHLESIDLSSPEAWQHAFERYAELRQRCPVLQAMVTSTDDTVDLEGLTQQPVWLVTDYEANSRGMLNPAIGVDVTPLLTPEQQAELSQAPDALKPLMRDLLSLDPPEHTRLRRLAQPAFTASRIEKLRPRIQAITDDLLDGIEAHADEAGEQSPNRHMELISQFAYPLPVTVICEMLGIPAADREQTRRWSENLLKPMREDEAEAMVIELGEFVTYLRALFAERRAAPQNDMITDLLQVEAEGDRLSEDELLALVFILFVAGHITTVNLITNGLFALLTHPDQLADLRANPALIANAVEEMLRYYGPVETSTLRWALQDFEMEGQQIEQGDALLFMMGSANHDPKRLADPEAFNISRTDANRHIAFGKGIHACLGAPLARLEGQIAIGTLVKRYPDLRLAVPASEITWDRSFLRSLTSLPLTF